MRYNVAVPRAHTDEPQPKTGPISAAIRHARVSRDDTQAELARLLGMRTMTVSDWERGVVDCGDKALAHVANAYGTTPDALLVEWLSAGFSTAREGD